VVLLRPALSRDRSLTSDNLLGRTIRDGLGRALAPSQGGDTGSNPVGTTGLTRRNTARVSRASLISNGIATDQGPMTYRGSGAGSRTARGSSSDTGPPSFDALYVIRDVRVPEVDSRPAEDGVPSEPIAGLEAEVAPPAANEPVDPGAVDHDIPPGPQEPPVRSRGTLASFLAPAASGDVRPPTGGQAVGSWPSPQLVLPQAAAEGIGACASTEDVVAAAPEDHIAAPESANEVISRRAVEFVGAIGPRDRAPSR
jgi:hypothetical protein